MSWFGNDLRHVMNIHSRVVVVAETDYATWTGGGSNGGQPQAEVGGVNCLIEVSQIS